MSAVRYSSNLAVNDSGAINSDAINSGAINSAAINSAAEAEIVKNPGDASNPGVVKECLSAGPCQRQGALKWRAMLNLTKPRIVSMVAITAALGFVLGNKSIGGDFSLLGFVVAMVGTSLCCAGAGVLNSYVERSFDARMERTKRRPLPSGEVEPAVALAFGICLVLVGVTALAIWTNLLTAFLALLTEFLYVHVYTPLKRVTWLNTLIGAIPGALPPLGGWSAATGEAGLGGWILFLLLFVWQLPHFYAIAWMYKDDYLAGGFKMLPGVDSDGAATMRQIIWYAALLLPVAALPTMAGLAGITYLVGVTVGGALLFKVCLELWQTRDVRDARRVLRATVFYLPLCLALIVFDAMIL